MHDEIASTSSNARTGRTDEECAQGVGSSFWGRVVEVADNTRDESEMTARALDDLFGPVVPTEKRHAAFENLRNSEFHASTRQFVNDIAQRMGDPDGNLVIEFQSQGFHARLFELACFAYLEAQGADIDRSGVRPDFLVSREGKKLAAVEAVTAHSTEGQLADVSLLALRPESAEDIIDRCANDFPIRIGRALNNKLKKEYWSLPHCADVPLVLAIGPFHEPGSGTYIDESLARYLYGVDRVAQRATDGWSRSERPVLQHQYAGRSIPSGFFNYPKAENISAIIYANQWTVSRFDRIVRQAVGWSTELVGTRQGPFLLPGDEFANREFEHRLGAASTPDETWWQGVTIFHNPRALRPLQDEQLRCTSSFCVRDGLVEREVYDFHPLTSWMHIQVKREA
jgi:hypothetical protein